MKKNINKEIYIGEKCMCFYCKWIREERQKMKLIGQTIPNP